MPIRPITTMRGKMSYEKQQRFISPRFARNIPTERFLLLLRMSNMTIENGSKLLAASWSEGYPKRFMRSPLRASS
jgi:hypothetical protein